ncbi:MAG: J domain-containing protein [Oscillospiraceae bacterium]|nr:J domain-containing protein [Oscillospiraceae bacterium]
MDAYKVLGVAPNASDDEIKQAYKNIARQYHPDNYAGSPLLDVAKEKMEEINNAYDIIMNERRSGHNRQENRHNYRTSGGLQDIRSLIMKNRLTEAEELLDGIPAANRDGEWHFLKGSVFFSRGWLEESANYFEAAVRMNPENAEYRAAASRLKRQRHGHFNPGTSRYRYGTNRNSNDECDCCDMCSALMCADCLCKCIGGRGLCC